MRSKIALWLGGMLIWACFRYLRSRVRLSTPSVWMIFLYIFQKLHNLKKYARKNEKMFGIHNIYQILIFWCPIIGLKTGGPSRLLDGPTMPWVRPAPKKSAVNNLESATITSICKRHSKITPYMQQIEMRSSKK